MRKRNYLILPERIVLDIMNLVARLGETAMDYHNRVGTDETTKNISVYTRIMKKLMNLEEHDMEYEESISFEELLKQCGVRKPKRRK